MFLLYDMDLAGVSNSKKIKKMFPDLQILLIPKKYKCKDMSDFYKKYGLFSGGARKRANRLIDTARTQ